jgi:hypothetical protein
VCCCSECLGKLSDDTLGKLVRGLEEAFGKDWDWDDVDLSLEDLDAETMGSVFAVVSSGIEEAVLMLNAGLTLSPQDLAQSVARMQAQLTQGLALLSQSAATRLAPVLDAVNLLLADMSAGNVNPIQAGSALQNILDGVALAGGGAFGAGVYSPYEWSRLCRTESAFARSAMERDWHTRAGGDPSAVDYYGWPPIHPQCMCGTIMLANPQGKEWIVIETTPSACGYCNDIADFILAMAGF